MNYSPQYIGPLRGLRLTPEIQQLIIDQVILAANSVANAAGLATVNSSWQILVEAMTFRHISIDLEAQGENGADHTITILTPTRVRYLKELNIRIEWPFYLSAQTGRRFSSAQGSEKMKMTIKKLALFLNTLGTIATSSTAHGLHLSLQPVKPPLVMPSYNITDRGLWRRRRKGPEIHNMWSSSGMLKLSSRQRESLPNVSVTLLQNFCARLPMVTGLTFPPDFFPPEAVPALLDRFPNIRSINLSLMSTMGDTDSWRTNLFKVDLAVAGLRISKLTLGRDNDLNPDPYDRSSYYHVAATNPRHAAYIAAIRNYTRNLETLHFNHFAAPVIFYTMLLDTRHLTDKTFQWANLQQVHILMHGDEFYHGKRAPEVVNSETHLSWPARASLNKLFCTAGAAVAKMPNLTEMKIHIPHHRAFYLLAITLKFAVQSRRDAALSGIWGSPGKLDIWAAPKNTEVEDVWSRSTFLVGKMLLSVEWHDEECPDPN